MTRQTDLSSGHAQIRTMLVSVNLCQSTSAAGTKIADQMCSTARWLALCDPEYMGPWWEVWGRSLHRQWCRWGGDDFCYLYITDVPVSSVVRKTWNYHWLLDKSMHWQDTAVARGSSRIRGPRRHARKTACGEDNFRQSPLSDA